MSTLFISHASRDRDETLAVCAWLESQGWKDVFLDIDPDRGIVVGERWLDALKLAGERCEAVLVLLSEAWLASSYCMAEYLLARFTNKPIFGALLSPGLITRLEGVITSDTQLCALTGDGPTERVRYTADGADREAWFLADGLSRLRDGLQRAGLRGRSFQWPAAGTVDRAPYRGLQPLDREDAAVFFGRDIEIAQCRELLRGLRGSTDERLLVLVAGSGSGKSSFLRAGLLPRLAREDFAFLPLEALRPMTAPITGDQGLAHRLAATDRTLGAGAIEAGAAKLRLMAGDVALAELVTMLRRRALASKVAQTPAPTAPTVVITVDQAEELFSPAVSSDESARLLALLADAARQGMSDASSGCAAIVIFAVRADQFERLRTAPALQGLKMRVFDGLRPMDRAQFKEVIEEPAKVSTAAGRPLRLEPELVQALLDDSEHSADALPLLAVTLSRLLADFGAGGWLRLSHYRDLGGLKAVLAHEVESALAPLTGTRANKHAALRDAFIPWLVNVDPGTGQRSRRVADPRELPRACEEVIQAMVERKLLVTDERDGRATLEVAHEALLGQWPPLVEWIDEVRAELALQRTADREAQAWHAAGRSAASLWAHERQVALYAALARLQVKREHVAEPLRSFIRPEADRLLEEIASNTTSHARRVDIGDRLSTIGDTRPGVGLGADGGPELAWCAIPAGPEGRPAAFQMARYPVTRLQFAAFLASRDGAVRPQPLPLLSNRPVERVSFDEATAFCAWLSSRLGVEVGLPSAEQRLWAMSGAQPGAGFPWGLDWDPWACNSRAAGLGRTTAVGVYPAGASPQTVHDLVGNVWEWTATAGSSGNRLLLYGGSWYGHFSSSGTHAVTDADRAYRGANVGFRLICAPADLGKGVA